jgi:hypothetical protein
LVVLLLCACGPSNHEGRSLFDGYPAVAFAPATRNTAAQDPDFGFRYESKGCPYEVIDAFKGTYRTYGMTVPIPMKLTEDERATIFKAIVASRFFDLPRTINQPHTAEWGADTYKLAVWNVSYHAVLWEMTSDWQSTDAGSRLMKLHRTIVEVVHARPDVARAQPIGCGCAGPR